MKKYSFFLFTICCLLLTRHASAAIIYSQAANQDVYEGQTFVLDWFLDTEQQNINSINLKVNFSAQNLEVIAANTGNSLISLWIENPQIDNQQGKLELIGGIPNGANGNKVPIFRTVFKAKSSGQATISLDPASMVLRNDGRGTADLLKSQNRVFNIYPENFIPTKISSATHPDQTAWYQNRNAVINVETKPNKDYSYSFSSNLEMIPENLKQDVSHELRFPNLPDGIYYFKLNSHEGSSNWQEASVYRIQIDATPPEEFIPTISSDESVYDGSSFVSFSTLDKTAGISHYKARNGLFGITKTVISPLKLKKPIVGDKIQIVAVDLAGNSRVEYISFPGYISERMFTLIILLIGLGGLAWYWYKKRSQASI
ncbi:MAG: hypothetical protein KW802_01925 [Candidatus Doudnabacteria bacterium]|nr:hypothetical protein [Candidatus Doudnabacteria bacterium]